MNEIIKELSSLISNPELPPNLKDWAVKLLDKLRLTNSEFSLSDFTFIKRDKNDDC
jgi:hypothetical protein